MTVLVEVITEQGARVIELVVGTMGPQGPAGTPGADGEVEEAPIDGKQYVRKDAGWTEAPTTDSFLPPADYLIPLWTFETPTKEAIFSSPVGPVPLGAGNDVPCVITSSSDWSVYALKVSDGSMLWQFVGDGQCYGRCQWATIGGNTVVLAPAHKGGISRLDRTGWREASYKSLYEDPNRNAGNITAVAAVSGTVYEITSNKNAWNAGPNMFLRPDGGNQNAVVEVYNGAALVATGNVVLVTAVNKMRITVPVAPVAGNTYKILPTYESDTIFMHAGTVSVEGGVPYLYATGFDNCVRKIRISDMSEMWIYATLENIEPYPLVMNVGGVLKVFVVSVDGNLRRLTAGTGAVDWATNCSPETGTGVDSFSNACDLHGDGHVKIMVSSRDGRVYAVDAVTGVLETRSTNTQSWQFNEINSSAVPVKMPGQTGFDIVTGGDSGTVWRFDHQLNTMWAHFVVPNSINSSSVVHDLRGDGELCQLIGDMRGTIHVTRISDGEKLGSVYFKGGVEGWPYYGDIDGDGKVEMAVTTTDGFIHMFRFLQGALTNYNGIYPGLSRFTGTATKT